MVNSDRCQDKVKSVISGHSKRRPKIGLQDQLSLNAGQKYCRMLQGGAFCNTFDLHEDLCFVYFEWLLKGMFYCIKIQYDIEASI